MQKHYRYIQSIIVATIKTIRKIGCRRGRDCKLLLDETAQNLPVMEREAASASSSYVLRDYGIPSERSPDLLEPYVDSPSDERVAEQDPLGDSPVSNMEIGFEGLLWT